jgi:hypothetical protein
MVKYVASGDGNPFSCPWDSGQVGVAYITQETIDKEWATPGRRTDIEGKTPEERARAYLDGELSTYTDWCNGRVYYYVVEDTEGEHYDSCGGIYGEDEAEAELKAAMEDARETIDKERAEAAYWREREVLTV